MTANTEDIFNLTPEDEQKIMENLNKLVEAQPQSSGSNTGLGSVIGPDIPALREELAVLVSSGKIKEAIGKNFSYDDVERLSDSDVLKYGRRYQAYVGSKTTKTVNESIIFLATAVVGKVLPIKDMDRLRQDFRDDFLINHELSKLSGAAALKLGRGLAAANAALMVARNVDYDALGESFYPALYDTTTEEQQQPDQEIQQKSIEVAEQEQHSSDVER